MFIRGGGHWHTRYAKVGYVWLENLIRSAPAYEQMHCSYNYHHHHHCCHRVMTAVEILGVFSQYYKSDGQPAFNFLRAGFMFKLLTLIACGGSGCWYFLHGWL
jgi:hypothetical protein